VRRVVTEEDVPREGTLRVPRGTIFTPSARDLARERGVKVEEVAPEDAQPEACAAKTLAFGSDHGGFEMKERLTPVARELGWTVRDVGVFEEKAADYPDIAHEVARLVVSARPPLG